MFSGVRPSSGAETFEHEAASEMPDAPERAGVAAAEEGRTPVNRYIHGINFNRRAAKAVILSSNQP